MFTGIYAVTFESGQNSVGGGIAVITDDGKLLGGDAVYFYRGTFEARDGVAAGRVQVENYQGDVSSIFGAVKGFGISFEGPVYGPPFVIAGHVVERPEMALTIVFKKLSDL